MPTQRRRIPPKNIGRFNYWRYFPPMRVRISAREPMKRYLLKQFLLLLSEDMDTLEAADAHFKEPPDNRFEMTDCPLDNVIEIYPVGISLHELRRNRPLYALKYYAENDKEWEQEAEAQKVYKALPAHEQKRVQNLFRKKWGTSKSGRRNRKAGKRDWDALLTQIAKDQIYFAGVTILGPTQSGLVETKALNGETREPLWKKYRLSLGTAKRVYQTYCQKFNRLLGEPTLAPKELHAELKRLGYVDARGRFPGRPLISKWRNMSKKDRERFSAIPLHWFAHALRNLNEWRFGRPEIPWDGDACMAKCLNFCERLAQRPPSPLQKPHLV
jgi:hypothetical protein